MFRLILLVLLSLFSLLTDRMLGLFGFPTELQLQTSHAPNFREVRRNIEFTHEFQTNSQGLRYKEIPLRKPPGTFRIFVVGDSMTEGTGVQSNETFSAILEDAFSNHDAGGIRAAELRVSRGRWIDPCPPFWDA
jgi:hypothetical protein